jgi:heme-degrading monooxygenase HmoA
MAEAHDRIGAAQLNTYQAVDVLLFEHRLDIGERFPADFAGASLVRLAHCHVKANRQAHFIRAQSEVWNPGMTGAPGMCRGVFAQRGETEFLVLSLWRSAVDHEHYLSDRFPGLRQRSAAADDLDSITGDLIDLEPAWTVTA